ncbi:hypothetical protein LPB140_01195 [Sphingorhabdus lutea]|uniref:HupE/UreJ family protein n=2 Tax=Sphingorhabdus lutea TaxID=1913578 RepID=A0A1L3JE73_9SPHN|nr:hypothetical protein LPB140_01195 [Sphingorhabdus lutea]
MILSMPYLAHADELRPGYYEVNQQSASIYHIIWKAPLRTGIGPQSIPIFPKDCILKLTSTSQTPQSVIRKWDARCGLTLVGREIGLSNLEASQTDILVRVQLLGRPIESGRLMASRPFMKILADAGPYQIAVDYFYIGVEHILFGFDHLLFVLCLVLLIRRGRSILIAASAFTLSHSITLVGSSLGYMGLAQRPVEAIIALSIIFLAAEIIAAQRGKVHLTSRRPWIVAFIFGLLHGFGFAGALSEIGLPQTDMPLALLSFNVGVEAGQILVILCALLILALIGKFMAKWQDYIVKCCAYIFGGWASYWFFERIFFS